jgi:hypothetical protein
MIFPDSHSRCKSPSRLRYICRTANNTRSSKRSIWHRKYRFLIDAGDRPLSAFFVPLLRQGMSGEDGNGELSMYVAVVAKHPLSAGGSFPILKKHHDRTQTSDDSLCQPDNS